MIRPAMIGSPWEAAGPGIRRPPPNAAPISAISDDVSRTILSL
jgi:hypothetical protein